MLDKSIPYCNIIMKRESQSGFEEVPLPEGYSFLPFEDGDEIHWAKIETAVGEFENSRDAVEYFRSNYMKYEEELPKRVFFLADSEMIKVGTITAWWNYTGLTRNPSVHWVGILPEYQNGKLGRALINYGVKKLLDIEGCRDIYLHTQTWSYVAVWLYLKEGFKILSDETFGGYGNDYHKAIEYLYAKLPQLKMSRSFIN